MLYRSEAQRCSGITSMNTQKNALNQKFNSSKIITHTFSMIKKATTTHENIKGYKPENDDYESISRKQPVPLSMQSKKISKPKDNMINRRVLGEITNQMTPAFDQSLLEDKVVEKPKEREFKEEMMIKASACPINLKYLNKRSKKLLSFKCYWDRDLKFPKDYANKTVDQNCDNDCSSDEDQINNGIRNLFRSLEGQVRLMKEFGKKFSGEDDS